MVQELNPQEFGGPSPGPTGLVPSGPSPDQGIRITSYANVAASLSGNMKVLSRTGYVSNIPLSHTTVATRTATVTNHSVPDGVIQGVCLYPPANTAHGRVYVKIESYVNNQPVAVLFAGFITNQYPGSWPVSGSAPRPNGGYVQVVEAANPAAGANLDKELATGASWKIWSIGFKLVCDANVANRTIGVQAADSGDKLLWVSGTDSEVVTAGQTAYVMCGGTASLPVTANVLYTYGSEIFMLPLSPSILPGGCAIKSMIGSMQAGDQISEVRIVVEEWIEGL